MYFSKVYFCKFIFYTSSKLCKFIAIVAVAWQPLSRWSNTTPTTFVTFTHWKFLSEIISMYICGECDQIEVWKVVLPTNLKCLSPLGNRGGKCIRNIFSKLLPGLCGKDLEIQFSVISLHSILECKVAICLFTFIFNDWLGPASISPGSQVKCYLAIMHKTPIISFQLIQGSPSAAVCFNGFRLLSVIRYLYDCSRLLRFIINLVYYLYLSQSL